VRTDRGERDNELRGDLTRSPTLHHVEKNLAFGGGEAPQGRQKVRVAWRRPRWEALELLEPLPLGRTTPFDFTVESFGHRDELVRQSVDVQKAGGTLFYTGSDTGGAGAHTQCDDRGPSVDQCASEARGVLPRRPGIGAR